MQLTTGPLRTNRDLSPYWPSSWLNNTGGVIDETDPAGEPDHFKPTGTLFIVAMFVVTLILLWASVYVILLSRGVTT